jgi:hypothetical protein
MTEALRIWERRAVPVPDGSFEIPLRFRVVPGIWPEIEIAPADGTNSDLTAPAYEVRLRCDLGAEGTLSVDVAGFAFGLVGRTVTTREGVFIIPGSGSIALELLIRGDSAALVVDAAGPLPLAARVPEEHVLAAPVSENVSGLRLAARPPGSGRIVLGGGAKLLDAMVYGLREPETAIYRTADAAVGGPGRTFFASPAFVVSDACVADGDGEPALVPDRRTIVSPIRVVEEFEWRDTPYGDMTRVVGRAELWHSSVEPGRFPVLKTGFRSIDATFELAVETFQRNSSGEFSLPGEAGLWSAGYFQGSGLGFGSWKRDTSHVALRCGNLLDPEVARASLVHVVNGGFDNGSDGDVLPAGAVWDHLLATGDASLIDETWPRLAATASRLDARFDDRRGLVLAPQSTSNDLFEEPEVGGFALSTEVYAMESYAALARMASLPNRADPRADMWAARAAAMRQAIIVQYWNPDYGYFTSGPVGSESYAQGFWETSGAEAALWGFLGADAEPMAASVLDRMRDVAMSEYGVVLFPYKSADNHFCNSVWYCWQAGIARAAARVGDAGLVHRLIAQQVRTVVRNKTFYEVTDASTGDSWRWPGQLWHAAGFVSLVLFGLLGIRYDLDGMTFSPAVSPELDGVRLHGLRYRRALLDVEIRGHGHRCAVTLDGRPVQRIPPDVTGRRAVLLTIR